MSPNPKATYAEQTSTDERSKNNSSPLIGGLGKAETPLNNRKYSSTMNEGMGHQRISTYTDGLPEDSDVPLANWSVSAVLDGNWSRKRALFRQMAANPRDGVGMAADCEEAP